MIIEQTPVLRDMDALSTDGEIFRIILEKIEPFDYMASMQKNMSDINSDISSFGKTHLKSDPLSELKDGNGSSPIAASFKILQIPVQYKVLATKVIHLAALKATYPFLGINNQLYIWCGICFSTIIDDDDLRSFFRACGEKSGVPQYIIDNVDFLSKLKAQFISMSYISKQKDKRKILVNLLNGTLEISPDGKYNLRAHDPADLITYVLPFCYNHAAQASKWVSHLARVLPDKAAQMVMAEHFGNTFLPTSYLKLEKVLVLYGDGANGKSVCHDVITDLLGPENITHYSLENLCNSNGYHRAMIEGKLLNYCSELSSKMNTDYFKKLASGEPVDVRSVREKPRLITEYAKLVFNCNELPQNLQANMAYFRRLNILRFDVTIPESEQDKQLAAKIISDELPGIFNWILDGLTRLINQKNFTVCESSNEQVALYKKESNNVQIFIEDNSFVKDSTKKMPVDDLFTMYTQYCKANRYSAHPKNIFSKRLKALGFDLQRDSKRSNILIRQDSNGSFESMPM